MIRSTGLAVLALLAAAAPAGALFEGTLDAFGATVADRLSVLPATGGTKDEAKARKALLKAQAALALPSADRPGDLGLAKKAAAAVQKALAADAVLLAILDEALDAYGALADGEVAAYAALVAELPAGPAKSGLEKKLLGVGKLLAKEGTATVLSARAALLAKAFRKLVPVAEALEEGPPGGPCPEPGDYDVEIGTVTALVGGEAWSASDLDVILVVDSDTMAVLQLGLVARRPDGTGGTLDEINFTFDTGDFTGPGAYPFDTVSPYIVGINYIPDGPGFTYQGLDGVITITEFSFSPTAADPTIAGGRLVGTFAFNGCTTYYPSGVCAGPDVPIAVTGGAFEVCNFNVIYY